MMISNNKNVLKPMRVARMAGLAFVASVALNSCAAPSPEGEERLRTDLTTRGLDVMSITTDGFGDRRADVSFGDKGCVGTYYNDDSGGYEANSLITKVSVPGSTTETQYVTVDNPSEAVLRQYPAIGMLCFSDYLELR